MDPLTEEIFRAIWVTLPQFGDTERAKAMKVASIASEIAHRHYEPLLDAAVERMIEKGVRR